jgi:hypothetical protein
MRDPRAFRPGRLTASRIPHPVPGAFPRAALLLVRARLAVEQAGGVTAVRRQGWRLGLPL